MTDQPSFGLAMTYGRMGKRDEAMRVIRTLEEHERVAEALAASAETEPPQG